MESKIQRWTAQKKAEIALQIIKGEVKIVEHWHNIGDKE